MDGNGPRPIATGPVAPHSLGLMLQVKACEQAVIRAATTQSRPDALFAIAAHPLVDSVPAAIATLDGYAEAFPELSGFRTP